MLPRHITFKLFWFKISANMPIIRSVSISHSVFHGIAPHFIWCCCCLLADFMPDSNEPLKSKWRAQKSWTNDQNTFIRIHNQILACIIITFFVKMRFLWPINLIHEMELGHLLTSIRPCSKDFSYSSNSVFYLLIKRKDWSWVLLLHPHKRQPTLMNQCSLKA